MGIQSKTSPLAALPLNHRRNAFAILLVTVVLARSGHILDLDEVVDTFSLKAWREARRQRRDERKRRQMETPLYVYINDKYLARLIQRNTPALEKKMVDLVSWKVHAIGI
jgi:hypothetical protein